jgi:hypothetical protein
MERHSPSSDEFDLNNNHGAQGLTSRSDGNQSHPASQVRTRWHPKGRKPDVNRKAYQGKNPVFD